ncbi:MAG: alpha-galactosidase [Filimonas sp.]|nr:alpha-galactosidase [Filimonas sp.]
MKLIHIFTIAAVLTTQQNEAQAQHKQDWLVHPVTAKASIIVSTDKKVVLDNGLLRRTFVTTPDVACVDFVNLTNGQQLLRAIQPEARLVIDGTTYNVGGLYGQKENAYLLPQWISSFKKQDSSFHFTTYAIRPFSPFIQWKPDVWSANKKQPQGKEIIFSYQSSLQVLSGFEVQVHYVLFDGLPLLCKWLTIENKSSRSFKLNRVVNEVLAVVEEESAVVGGTAQMHKPAGIYVESDYAFNNAMRYDLSDQTLHWKADRAYTSQVNYDFNTPCLMEVYPEKAPGVDLQPGEQFTSVRSYELLMDSYDRERRALAIRTMYNTIAPWTTGNPIFMHLVSKNDEQVKTAVDQCAATGYEAVILSFGSHLNMEDNSAANLAKWKALADYAHTKGVKIGGYSLFSSRKISDEDDVISPKTGKPGGAFFGNAPCFGSKWGLAYRDKIKQFFTTTGFDIWENDGPYPGDVCASVTHPGHKGLDDSQWRQINIQKELYRWLNERGVYINAPDWYFLDGTNKIGLGYREVNFSLPRDQQKIINRQNIFDGTWEKTASMSWGFVPLTAYQGGGAEAVLEPLKDHLKDYDQLMMQYYGAGVQACYRGPRLYDTEETKQVVSNVVTWYKKYRDILNAPIIHLRRADGRDWDGILHVSPQQRIKGLVMLYNPLKESITRTITLPLYYTGLTTTAHIREKEGKPVAYPLNRDYTVTLDVTLQPDTYTWYVIE